MELLGMKILFVVGLLLMLLGAGAASFHSSANPSSRTEEPLSDFSGFASMSLADARTLQVKVSDLQVHGFGGIYTSFVIQGSNVVEDDRLFRGHGRRYINDPMWKLPRVHLTSESMLSLLREFQDIDGFESGALGNEETLAITLLAVSGTRKNIFECVADSLNSVRLIDLIRTYLVDDELGVILIDRLACWGDLLPTQAPMDVSEKAEVSISGIRLADTWKPKYRGKIVVTNTSDEVLKSPLSLAFRSQASGIEVYEPIADGVVCRAIEDRYYVDLEVGDGLRPQESVELDLLFSTIFGYKLRFDFRLLSGPGIR